ncbi:helix-turn-helix domain-containing protein [Paraburkholderia sp. HP33-1]|uniref:helix-turn-helix domain-containing protein n=1 Tax=Paraburkholderia sp. HP33-1 TaxID=2883243 RepID=UPI001F437157|nr:helix-turn-helix domain-containing protein [Paraburkholderia sp. HP33-1]
MATIEEEKFARRLGRALASARTEAGLTQEQVAAELGVFSETISRFERGANWPTLPRLIALANLYAVPLTKLIGPSSPRALDAATTLNEHLARLGEEDLAWVTGVVTELCERLSKPAGRRRH